MKRILLLLVCLLLFSTYLIADGTPVSYPIVRATDARIMAMGGAFTAIADNSNALYYNPAGLPYLSNSDLDMGLSFLIDTNSNMMNISDWLYEFPEIPDGYNIWSLAYNYEQETATWGYYGPSFDPTVYGFENSVEGVDALIDWYENTIPPLSILKNGVDQIRFIPNISFVNSNFGVGLLGDIEINPVSIELPIPLEYGFEFKKRSGLIAGIGFGFGSFSIGANVKYYKQVKTLFGLPSDSYIAFNEYMESLLPGVPIQDALIDIFMDDAIAVGSSLENRIEMGLGAMYTLGSLTFGTYVDSILGIILDENNELKSDFKSMIEEAAKTANIGIAFDPSIRKLTKKEPFMSILLSTDLKNIGDNERRVFNLGSEIGFHIGEFLQFDIRGGYKQYLTGPLDELFQINSISLNKGEVSIGAGLKFLFAHYDLAIAFPADMVRNVITTSALGGDLGLLDFTAYGPNFPRVMVSAGINL